MLQETDALPSFVDKFNEGQAGVLLNGVLPFLKLKALTICHYQKLVVAFIICYCGLFLQSNSIPGINIVNAVIWQYVGETLNCIYNKNISQIVLNANQQS